MLFSNENTINRSDDDFKRLSVKYEDLSKRFQFQTIKDYSKQFAHIYAARLNEMRELLTQRAREKWGTSLIWMALVIRFHNVFVCRRRISAEKNGRFAGRATGKMYFDWNNICASEAKTEHFAGHIGRESTGTATASIAFC